MFVHDKCHCEQVEMIRQLNRGNFAVKGRALLLKCLAKFAVNQRDGRKVHNARESRRTNFLQAVIKVNRRISRHQSEQQRHVADNRKNFALAELHDLRVVIAVAKVTAEGTAPHDSIFARAQCKQNVRAAQCRKFRRQAGADRRADYVSARINFAAQGFKFVVHKQFLGSCKNFVKGNVIRRQSQEKSRALVESPTD